MRNTSKLRGKRRGVGKGKGWCRHENGRIKVGRESRKEWQGRREEGKDTTQKC